MRETDTFLELRRRQKLKEERLEQIEAFNKG